MHYCGYFVNSGLRIRKMNHPTVKLVVMTSFQFLIWTRLKSDSVSRLGLPKSRKSRSRSDLSAILNLARFWSQDLRAFGPIKPPKIFNIFGEIGVFENVKWIKDIFWILICNLITQISWTLFHKIWKPKTKGIQEWKSKKW